MGASTVIGRSSRFGAGKWKRVFRGQPWRHGCGCDFTNLGFQISNSELTASRLQSQIPNSELPDGHCNTRGFTLIELMVVCFILLILATLSVPIFQTAIKHAREAVLKDDLYTLRKLIDEFTLDKQKAPDSLDDLVEAGYLRGGLPVDPFTGSNETWRTDVEDVPTGPGQAASGVVDVHSGSDEIALDGTPYSSW
jgi:general secretion pathway protein G